MRKHNVDGTAMTNHSDETYNALLEMRFERLLNYKLNYSS